MPLPSCLSFTLPTARSSAFGGALTGASPRARLAQPPLLLSHTHLQNPFSTRSHGRLRTRRPLSHGANIVTKERDLGSQVTRLLDTTVSPLGPNLSIAELYRPIVCERTMAKTPSSRSQRQCLALRTRRRLRSLLPSRSRSGIRSTRSCTIQRSLCCCTIERHISSIRLNWRKGITQTTTKMRRIQKRCELFQYMTKSSIMATLDACHSFKYVASCIMKRRGCFMAPTRSCSHVPYAHGPSNVTAQQVLRRHGSTRSVLRSCWYAVSSSMQSHFAQARTPRPRCSRA
jgi:hypothetical protein